MTSVYLISLAIRAVAQIKVFKSVLDTLLFLHFKKDMRA